MKRQTLARSFDVAPRRDSFCDAVLAGLARPAKAIPSRFLYDERGSALFEAICELPEYYVTRTEVLILAAHAADIASLAGAQAQLIEFGSGASSKVRLLLAALDNPASYVPIDISREHLHRAAAVLAAEFPQLDVAAVCADYTDPLSMPLIYGRGTGRRIGFFPGSSIGNFRPEEAIDFLRGCRALLGDEGHLIIGVDLKKDAAILNAAYNDAAGVTAEFSLNLLARMNRELRADFTVDRFSHVAFYNERRGRIEIYIRSHADQTVSVAGRRFAFSAGEMIHTEYSYKYSVPEFQALARRAGYKSAACWTDSGPLFSVHYLRTE